MIARTFSTKTRGKAVQEVKPQTGDIRLTEWVPDESTYDARLARFKDKGRRTRSGITPYPDRNIMMTEIIMVCPEKIPARMRTAVLRQCCRVLVSEFGKPYGNRNIQFARIRENRLEFGFIPLVDGEIAASRRFNEKKDTRPLLEKMNTALMRFDGYSDGDIYPTLFEYFGLRYGRA